ncbi:hypothetical protein Mp_5g14690 [Marchantia polymorpha subsp. ruderalis]|uniref:Uncharacterized protein n=2 Tax=Marchantia polymorpha TaxID=3197 RepID=A0AAF6BIE7_MARPO|nr:hypothetical protein MARPO_0032s0161 [Marchantia polymorpha]BBN11781.1 hypothetical protein Mp_5g14690 [Marchantia polymorpha subsp. ruderalis]|eukprot:PTQ41999.1 hypothetical protein MARPO_0032s0161 [Marchantia polymorpha]
MESKDRRHPERKNKSLEQKAESQRIEAARLLCCLQYLVPYSSRLQRIHLPNRLELRFKAPERRLLAPARGNSRHMLQGTDESPLPVVG